MRCPVSLISSGKFEKSKSSPHGLKMAGYIFGAILLLIVLFLSYILFMFKGIYPGVSVLGTDLSYQTQNSAYLSLSSKQTTYNQSKLELSIYENAYEITPSEIGAEFDAKKASDIAYFYGRTGNILTRINDISKSFFNVVDLDAFSHNDLLFGKKIEEITNDVNKHYKDYSYEIVGSVLKLDTGKSKITIDKDKLSSFVLDRFKKADFSKAEFLIDSPEKNLPDLNELKKAVDKEVKDAQLDLMADPTGGTITPEIIGVELNIDDAKKAIEEQADKQIIDIPVKVTEPEITKAELSVLLFKDTLSSVHTTLNPGLTDRTYNVKLSASIINGKILNPGDEFSYNGIVGPRTAERGFRDAKIFQDGEIIDGLGGGICQTSSTLYMATLHADLDITSRRNHMFTVSYTKLGEDATVVYGSTDFKFINNTKYPIKIKTVQSGSQISAVIYGTAVNNKEVKLVTNILSKTPYEKLTVDDPTLAYGITKIKSDGHTGYKTKTYRVVYIDGKEVSRTLENTSVYTKLDDVTLNGTLGKPADNTQTINPQVPTDPNDSAIPEEPVDYQEPAA